MAHQTSSPIADKISGMGIDLNTDVAAFSLAFQADARPGATKLQVLDLDNAANSAVSYFKIYDATTFDGGVTDPDWVLPVPASGRRIYVFTESDEMGMSIANGISYGAARQGGTGGTLSPVSSLVSRFMANA